jgi:all-trans-retinol 13,14-reductase
MAYLADFSIMVQQTSSPEAATTRSAYDTVVIGSGLAGLTSANQLAKAGHRVLVLEQHYQYGGLATWFKRPGGHVFDISLHGFPVGMKKSCRRYWTQEIADAIVPLRHVRMVNPQFDLETSFDLADFTRHLVETFGAAPETVEAFFAHLQKMDFFDQDRTTNRELFERYFPGRDDIKRFLFEPIAYANGSSEDDPAITYGIVISNFLSKGIFTFVGGTDWLIRQMVSEARRNGVEFRRQTLVREIVLEEGGEGERPRVKGVQLEGEFIPARSVISNANLKTTLFRLLPETALSGDYRRKAEAVRVNSSSCQVYLGIDPSFKVPFIGDLIFTSESPRFASTELTDFHTRSRTFSVYYPESRPHLKDPRTFIVASLNARWSDWEGLSEEAYLLEKQRLIEESVASLERFLPGVSGHLSHREAATPKTFNFYTQHWHGTSFGTKFEGLEVSAALPDQISGLFHAGSVGIIMSGWLGTMNYGVIVANKADAYVRSV